MTTNFKLTAEQFDKLFDSNTSRAELGILLELVNERFTYIIDTIDHMFQRKHKWFDYDNEGESDGQSFSGFFDPIKYKNDISFVGEFENPEHKKFEEKTIPTVWLKEDFEIDIHGQQLEVEEYKEVLQQRKQQCEEQFILLQNSIHEKLTAEELACLSFNFQKFEAAFFQKIKNQIKEKE